MAKGKAEEVGRLLCEDGQHAVVTLARDEPMVSHRVKPCEECPWRRDAPIGAFPTDAYDHSATTAHDMSMNTFACHMSADGKPQTCAGFLMRGADHNLSIRMAYADGRLDPNKFSDGGIELYDDYVEMAEANGCDVTKEVYRLCRRNR